MVSQDVLIERLLRVIDEGRRTATYKLALLLAVIEAAALSPGESELPTRLIADQVLGLYYPQTRRYIDGRGVEVIPRQISMKSSAVLTAVQQLRDRADVEQCRALEDVRTALPVDYQSALDRVEDTFVRYPIPLMQVVGAGVVPFLYEVDWAEGTSVRELRRKAMDRVRLLDGVSDRLVVLGPMLRPLIELHWTKDVARWTGLALEDEALRDHLFGTHRRAFPRSFVDDLADLQRGECFYCGERLASRREVDHFLAWSRWPNDAVENLVVADRCNGAKSDHLVATGHLARWRIRTEVGANDLRNLAAKHGWLSAAEKSQALVRTTYGHVAPGTPLWVRGRDFEFADGPLVA